MHHAHTCETCSLASLFTGAKEAKFPYFSKENQSPLGLCRNPLTIFFTNPQFVILLHPPEWPPLMT